MRGLIGGEPDYALILIASNKNITSITKQHMIICLIRQIPMIIIFTKIDLAPEHVLKKNVDKITIMSKGSGVGKVPLICNNRKDIFGCVKQIKDGVIIPILKISNVTGENLDLLKLLINYLPVRINYKDQLKQPAVQSVNDKWSVPGIGCVVGGILLRGKIKNKNKYFIGPNSLGRFRQVVVKGIQMHRIDIAEAFAGQSITLALRDVKKDEVSTSSMVLLESNDGEPLACYEIIAEIEVFKWAQVTIKIG